MIWKKCPSRSNAPGSSGSMALICNHIQRARMTWSPHTNKTSSHQQHKHKPHIRTRRDDSYSVPHHHTTCHINEIFKSHHDPMSPFRAEWRPCTSRPGWRARRHGSSTTADATAAQRTGPSSSPYPAVICLHTVIEWGDASQ